MSSSWSGVASARIAVMSGCPPYIARCRSARTAIACPGVQSSGTEISMVMSPPGSRPSRLRQRPRPESPAAGPGRGCRPHPGTKHWPVLRRFYRRAPPLRCRQKALRCRPRPAARRRSSGGVQPADRRAVGGAPERFQLAVPWLTEQPGEFLLQRARRVLGPAVREPGHAGRCGGHGHRRPEPVLRHQDVAVGHRHRGEHAERGGIAEPQRVAAGTGFLRHLEAQPVPPGERGGDLSRRAGLALPGKLGAHHAGCGGLAYPRHAHRHAKNPGHRPFHMGTERRGRGMYVQNAANGHPGLPACGRGASSPTTSAPPQRPGLRSRDMLPLALLFGFCLTSTARRQPLARVAPAWCSCLVDASASRAGAGAARRRLTERDIAALLFVADMYAVQLDHLAAVLGVTQTRARAIALDWRRARYAESARIGPGHPWLWLTRAGLAACGLPYTATSPALSRLAHLRAVAAVRLALEAAAGYAPAGAFWRGERRLRARAGGRVGLREHIPDGEVHWPDGAPVGFAGECWAIEAELSPKTVPRTAAIMREVLARTGDYGCPATQALVPGAPPRHARVVYLCSAAARPTVARARDALGDAAGRVEIRALPPGAGLTGPAGRGGGRPR